MMMSFFKVGLIDVFLSYYSVRVFTVNGSVRTQHNPEKTVNNLEGYVILFSQ